MAQVAQDTFVAELKSGPLLVTKGMVFADGHEVVKLDKGRGQLFKPLDLDENEGEQKKAPSPRPRAKAGQ